ncbi:MFS transporter [Bacillus sp. 2205SS5-2]|uniref:MFS transporter n=1 Tax=Bacillus sp. 2205SS5-2 TaxID=3109031 RepID=UPI003005AE1E
MFNQLHSNIKIRILTTFLSRLASSMILPFIPIYFTTAINAYVAGILLMIQIGFEFIASFYGGYAADTIGRKRMMVIGEWMTVAAFIGILIVNSPWITSPWLTFLMLIIIGIATGLIYPASEAMLIDVSTKETRAFMYSISYWVRNFSLMLGLMIGGWFFQTNLFELLLALLILSIVTVWITLTYIEETHEVVRVDGERAKFRLTPFLKSYRAVSSDWPFVLFTLGGIAIIALEFQRVNFIAVRLNKEFIPQTFALSDYLAFSLDGVKLITLLTVENTFIIVLCTAIVAKWISTQLGKEQLILFTGFLLFGSGYAVLAFSNHLLTLFLAVIVLTIGELLYVPTRQTILADIIDDSRRGSYLAFNGLVIQIGKLFGALGIIVGEIIGGTGMAAFYLLFAFLAIGFSKLGLVRRNRKISENIISEIV